MIPKRALVTTVVAAGLILASSVGFAQQKDPFVGSWTMDPAKSKYSPGPAPKSVTVTYEAAGKGYKVSVAIEPATGAAQQWAFTADLDGKDVPVTANPNADTVALTRIDANTLQMVSKKAGKVTTTQKIVISADGKTRTSTTTGTNAQGQTVNNVAVFTKK